MTSIEAIVLTGGGSRRMGQDKAKLQIDGVAQADRIVRQFLASGISVTVLGREPIEGARFLQDKEEYGGPIAALSQFTPTHDHVFVASCDLPRFDVALVTFLQERIADADACAPMVDNYRQPLCALYTTRAFAKLKTLEDQCAMGWLDAIEATIVSEEDLVRAGLRPAVARGANTPAELASALTEVVD